ncbi:hypothetical protein L249_1684 [Ophiocordyceps polyrhachis-furcata BCC 54312]|uniref:C2H2-type domain-containing protein n=1 Tax=Ophiocordyceps polyrhachis-furcata BCC 54312 TaxID=1330021 RepID=A0A367LQ06_9HYPO|nr:hypothetical protein L249_1684 [Ophiocordyceps polyrhachis-furcata BCC 54312]
MDRSQNLHLRPSAFPNRPSSSSPPLSDQQLDASPQDVLAEARKNLQVLIDSGLSKDLLHQWVDDSQSLQLSFSLSSQPLASLSKPIISSSSPSPPPPPPPPPPHPTPPPPPPPPPPRVSSTSTPVMAASTIPVKSETLPDDVSRTWPPSTLASNAATNENPLMMTSSASFPHAHRPRISVSSVSSGSSGHASIWSTNSTQSSFSWHSATSGGRSMAPLPMPPAATVLNGSHMASAASSPSRQNVYWCTSCETSFKRKYDWKRHEDEFHERWRKYPCPEPGCNRSFWGSNSFNQHHKQCHGCKTCPHAEKVVKFLRKRKYWACGFCSALHPARERHVEHVARHFESGMSKGDWMHSRVIYGLLHQPLIHEAWDALVATKQQADYAGRRPQFSWHPSKTGRAQGFLEKESAGQLQDLLEFFSGDDSEAQWIVSSAYDLADIVLTSSPQFAPAQHFPPPADAHSVSTGAAAAAAFAQTPSMMSSSSPGGGGGSNPGSSYNSPFRSTANTNTTTPSSCSSSSSSSVFVPSQQPFSSADSSKASSQSPMTASQSPMAVASSQSPLPPRPSHSPLQQRDLPQLPSSSSGTTESLMDFDYTPAPVIFDDWESLSGTTMHDVSEQQPEWGMMQYFGDPRVTS